MLVKTSVLKPWVSELPWKMQSALLSSLRGVDGGPAPRIKQAQKFLRGAVQHDADPTTTYMRADLSWVSDPDEQREAQNELGRLSLHYAHHLIEGLTIVMYFSDDKIDKDMAKVLVDLLLKENVHWQVENWQEIEERLS